MSADFKIFDTHKFIVHNTYAFINTVKIEEANWQKTSDWAKSSNKLEPSPSQFMNKLSRVVEDFVYFRDLRNSSTQSSADILQQSARISCSHESSFHRFWMSTSVKLKLYNTCVCPTLLYNVECCAITKDCKIDSLN